MKVFSPLQSMHGLYGTGSHGPVVNKPPPNSSTSSFSNLLNGAGSGLGSAATAALPAFANSFSAPMEGLGGNAQSAGSALPMTGDSLAPSPSAFGQAPTLGGFTPPSGGLPAPASDAAQSSSAPGGTQQMLRVTSDLIDAMATLSGGAAPGAAGAPPKGEAPASTKPSADDKRPTGDDRSAKDIIDADPTLKNLGNQSGVKDNLKKQVGDFENDPDAAYRASKVLDYVKSSKTSDGDERSGDVKDDGKINGFTKDGDARHGTEAGLLQDFGKNGYSALPDDHQLDKTNDKHVKKNGTNMNNLTFAGHEIAHGISDLAGKFSHALDNMPGPLKSLLGPMHMMASGISGGANVADAAMTGGDVKQAGKDMASGMLTTGSNIAQGVGELAGDTIGKVPGIGKGISAGLEIGSANISGGLDFANTAIQGGDLEQAGKAWGSNVAGTTAGVGVGMVDPTGVASGAVQSAVTNAIDPATQNPASPAMQGAIDPSAQGAGGSTMQGAVDPTMEQGPAIV